jgi:hypothetical protein
MNCGAGEGWRRSVGKLKVLHRVKEDRSIPLTIK